jgi:hypothetical protein
MGENAFIWVWHVFPIAECNNDVGFRGDKTTLVYIDALRIPKFSVVAFPLNG